LLNFCIIKSNNTIKINAVSAIEFAQLNPTAQMIQCTKNYPFNFKPYPIYQQYNDRLFPHNGLFRDIYIISIPDASAYFYSYTNCGMNGFIFVNNYFIRECDVKNTSIFCAKKTNTIFVNSATKHKHIDGSIAICSHVYSSCYGHFMLDVLCQLALLEIFNIEYDYLCIPYHAKFMKEALDLWGISENKIIPLEFDVTITANTIIIPTSTTQTQKLVHYVNYTADFLISHIRKKLLKGAIKKNTNFVPSPKIFISRKDANNKRSIPNEDEIFNLFKQREFKRYELTKLSLNEQILLFHNAQEIVSFVGSGALNIIFSKPNTNYIEITQTMIDATFCFLANIFDINYYAINATNNSDLINSHAERNGRPIDLTIINNFLKNYK